MLGKRKAETFNHGVSGSNPDGLTTHDFPHIGQHNVALAQNGGQIALAFRCGRGSVCGTLPPRHKSAASRAA